MGEWGREGVGSMRCQATGRIPPVTLYAGFDWPPPAKLSISICGRRLFSRITTEGAGTAGTAGAAGAGGSRPC